MHKNLADQIHFLCANPRATVARNTIRSSNNSIYYYLLLMDLRLDSRLVGDKTLTENIQYDS